MRTSLVATLVLLVACEKKPAPPPAPAPAVSTTTVASPAITPSTPAPAPDEPMPNATAASSAPAATSVPPAVAPAPSVVASAPVASSAPTPAPSASGPKTFACGGAGLPKCPLQKWMAEVMQPAMKGNDPAKLTAALEQSAKYGPPGYTDWNKWVKAGVAALAKDKNVAAAKPSCTGCHTDYKPRYKAEDRDRPL